MDTIDELREVFRNELKELGVLTENVEADLDRRTTIEELARLIQRFRRQRDVIKKIDRGVVKENGEQKQVWEWREGVADKLDEIVDWINNQGEAG